MSIQFIGDCADCTDGLCTMNCSTALAVSGSEAIWNAEGSEAMAKLLTSMAEYLDNGDGYFVPAEAPTPALAIVIAALRAIEARQQ